MAFLFGGKRDSSTSSAPKDPVREYQDELHRGCRTLAREDHKAGLEEKTLRSSIMAHARLQRLDICKIKAKELIRLREHRKRLVSTRGHMTSLIQQLSTVQSTKTLQGVMAKTSVLLRTLNTKTMEPVAIQKMLQEFERQSSMMEDAKEVMDETLDDIFQGDMESEAMDDTMASVFSELGLDARAMLPSPSHGGQIPRAERDGDMDLAGRLARLKAQV